MPGLVLAGFVDFAIKRSAERTSPSGALSPSELIPTGMGACCGRDTIGE
jgi:hypothetical protein